MRGDSVAPTIRILAFKFQFTPLREGRRFGFSVFMSISLCFNSRPCVRGDPENKQADEKTNKFQFTPLREGRLKCVVSNRFIDEVSIHAPA